MSKSPLDGNTLKFLALVALTASRISRARDRKCFAYAPMSVELKAILVKLESVGTSTA